MSLTQAQEVYAGIHEDALNDILAAFFAARPRHLVYGSPAFVQANTFAETQMKAIHFPGVPNGIQWHVRFTVPHVDLFPRTSQLPPEFSLGPGQLSLRLEVALCVACEQPPIDRGAPRDEPPPLTIRTLHDERPAPRGAICSRLQLFARGHIKRVLASGEDAIVLVADAVEIVDIAPSGLEAVLECLLLTMLRAALDQAPLPLRALQVGAFELKPTEGPLIEDDQVKVRGILDLNS